MPTWQLWQVQGKSFRVAVEDQKREKTGCNTHIFLLIAIHHSKKSIWCYLWVDMSRFFLEDKNIDSARQQHSVSPLLADQHSGRDIYSIFIMKENVLHTYTRLSKSWPRWAAKYFWQMTWHHMMIINTITYWEVLCWLQRVKLKVFFFGNASFTSHFLSYTLYSIYSL